MEKEKYTSVLHKLHQDSFQIDQRLKWKERERERNRGERSYLSIRRKQRINSSMTYKQRNSPITHTQKQ